MGALGGGRGGCSRGGATGGVSSGASKVNKVSFGQSNGMHARINGDMDSSSDLRTRGGMDTVCNGLVVARGCAIQPAAVSGVDGCGGGGAWPQGEDDGLRG